MSEYPEKPFEGRIPPRPGWLPDNIVLDESVPEFVYSDGRHIPPEDWIKITTGLQRWELMTYLSIVKYGWERVHGPIARVMEVVDLSKYDDQLNG